MAYTQNVDACLGIAGSGALEPVLEEVRAALTHLALAHQQGTLPLLHVPARRDDLGLLSDIADWMLPGATDIVILGTGGSSLGAQALAQLAGYCLPVAIPPQGRPRLHFLDNLDPWTQADVLYRLPLDTTRWLVVSKSGGTAETMAQMLTVLARLEEAGFGGEARRVMVALTETRDSPLARLAAAHGLPHVPHDPGVGGRYAVLTSVGALPALLMGLDPVAMREGAAGVLQPILDGADVLDVAPAVGAGVLALLERERGVRSHVLMGYGDRLQRFALWHRQLWAESLGKNGKGAGLEAATGPVDQHSQLQLWLDGPAERSFTLLVPEMKGQGPVFPAGEAPDPDLAWLSGNTVGDLVAAEAQATADSLNAAGRPVRTMRIETLNERALGALFMHFMLETIIAAHLLGVDPYDQPAVEDGKRRARAALDRTAGETAAS